jgi:hypothetical protein
LKRKQAAAIGKLGTSGDQATFISSASTWRSNAGSGNRYQESVDVHTLDPMGRSRQSSESPARSRARSLDERRIRNPSIARKYNRLLRVYDQDATNIGS